MEYNNATCYKLSWTTPNHAVMEHQMEDAIYEVTHMNKYWCECLRKFQDDIYTHKSFSCLTDLQEFLFLHKLSNTGGYSYKLHVEFSLNDDYEVLNDHDHPLHHDINELTRNLVDFTDRMYPLIKQDQIQDGEAPWILT